MRAFRSAPSRACRCSRAPPASIAHLLEEQTKPIGFVLSHAASKAIDYDGPVPPGFVREIMKGLDVLKGVKIVEQGTFITGPCCGMMLADLGADVIKVESPDGDPYRAYQGGNYSPAFPGLQPQQAQPRAGPEAGR